MSIKIKSLFFGLSIFFNAVFILLLFVSGFSKTSSFSFFRPDDNYLSAAAVVSVPNSQSVSIDLITFNLNPGDKAYIQFSVIAKKQGNLLITPLFDPNVISVSQTGYGLEITALKTGETLMQTLTNEGIKDVALITISE